MLNIVIVSGGTGSIALQNGLNNLYGIDNYNLDIVINAYDNGKSTGMCRSVFENKILGPSDLRKNQLTLFECVYKDALKNPNSFESKLHSLFELRFTADNYKMYYTKACQYIVKADYLSNYDKTILHEWVDYFFFESKNNFRKNVLNVNFTDFSLPNIFYAACAALNNYSLSKAGSEIAKILRIKDKVHLISDVSLLLKAETESGYIINDEGDIVCWDNPNDKIVKAILYNENGEYTPSVDELNNTPISYVFQEADIIIFSSGTQWSSLIPTYMHNGFKSLIQNCSAKKYLIMNNVEDHDMYGISADGILSILNQYLDLTQITIVLNDNAVFSMKSIKGNYNYIHGPLGELGEKRHIPEAVVSIILKDYFGLDKKYKLVSDLDGTLWDKEGDGHTKKIGIYNLGIFEGIILSGNSYEHVADVCKKYFTNRQNNYIYCDYGNTYFRLEDIEHKEILSEKFLIDIDLINKIDTIEDLHGKLRVRGGSILTIKPLRNRINKLSFFDKLLRGYDGEYEARIAGRTSIDIMKTNFDKEATLRLIIDRMGLNIEDILYLGNEINKGNELCIKNIGVKTIQVNDLFETYIFLKTFSYLNYK